MADFMIKQDDTAPSISATLQDAGGNAVDLTGASVKFMMADQKNKNTKVNAAASITDNTGGKVKYDWQSGDTDTAATYDAEWEVTYSDGKIETFPSSGYTVIQITRQIA